MPVKYNDPYGKREYAVLKGNKDDCFFKISFDEATLHKTDEAFYLYGNITEYQGVVRSFKPENPIQPGLCAVPFYGQEYEIRRKKGDNDWETIKQKPSIFEAALYRHFLENEAFFAGTGAAITGYISHLPDAMCQGMNDASLKPLITSNSSINSISPTGKIPAFTPLTGGGQRKSYGGYKSVSPEEKIAFLIKQIKEDIKHVDFKGEKTLAELTDQLIIEHVDNENFIQIYFDMLIACVK